MSRLPRDTTRLLGLLGAGDDRAREELIAHAYARLRLRAKRMLRGFPGVRRWEETDDVVQNAAVRLLRALEAVTPGSSRHFWRLAALQIRRELFDLARRYRGPHGQDANHHTDPGGALLYQATSTCEPSSPAEWAEFFEQVESLPGEERAVFDLHWVQGLKQEEAATVLGISVRTVKRHWQAARYHLAQAVTH